MNELITVCPFGLPGPSKYIHRNCRCEGCRTGSSEYRAKYCARPDVKKAKADHDKEYYARPEVKKAREEYKARPEVKRAAVEARADRMVIFYRFLETVKAERGCYDCGGFFSPEAMDFDHVRGQKVFQVSHGANHTWDRIQEEIDKCDIRCANCHRIETKRRAVTVPV